MAVRLKIQVGGESRKSGATRHGVVDARWNTAKPGERLLPRPSRYRLTLLSGDDSTMIVGYHLFFFFFFVLLKSFFSNSLNLSW